MKNAKLKFCKCRFDNLIFLDIKVGNEYVVALFDTGASVSIITQSLALRLQGKKGRLLSAGNNNGKTYNIESVIVDKIEIADCVAENVVCGVVPDDYFDFGTDDNGRIFPAQMFLGWELISRFYWRIDMRDRTYSVAAGGTADSNDLLTYENFPLIEINYQNKAVTLGFDTGHTETMLDKSWTDKIDRSQLVEAETVGVGGSLTEQCLAVNDFIFQFQSSTFCLKQATVLPRGIAGAQNCLMKGLLGIDFFIDTVFEIDFIGRHFKIEKLQ